MSVTAAEIAEALRRDYIRKPDMPAGVFMTEVGSPDGKRRADALYIPGVGGKGIIGHEIKISRSDVLAELADPHKAESWKQYCIRWWFVVADASLVDGLELPDDWGVKCPPTQANRRQFTIVKPAPQLDPHPLGPALGRLATAWAYRQRDHDFELRRAQLEYDQRNRQVAELEIKLNAAGVATARTDPNYQAAVDLAKALRERAKHFYLPGRDIGEIADAVIEANGVIKMRREIAAVFEHKRNQLNTALEDIRTNDWRVQNILAALQEDGVPA